MKAALAVDQGGGKSLDLRTQPNRSVVVATLSEI